MRTPEQVAAIVEALEKEYPLAECTLEETDPWKLLVQVRLAAQCTDARVNMVTPALFAKYPDVFAMAKAEVADVEHYIHSCGFYHGKARDIVACAQKLIAEHGGRVPDTMEELTALPGVGRKTANLILGDVYGQPAYVCDTHCIRITGRLGITDGSKDPVKVERQLREVIPLRNPTTSATAWCCSAGIPAPPAPPNAKAALWPVTAPLSKLPTNKRFLGACAFAQALFCARIHILG